MLPLRSDCYSSIEIKLDIDGAPALAHWSVPFTVAFSDADDASGQQTIVATSELRWNDADTLGELAHFSTRSGRFPGLRSRGASFVRRAAGSL